MSKGFPLYEGFRPHPAEPRPEDMGMATLQQLVTAAGAGADKPEPEHLLQLQLRDHDLHTACAGVVAYVR